MLIVTDQISFGCKDGVNNEYGYEYRRGEIHTGCASSITTRITRSHARIGGGKRNRLEQDALDAAVLGLSDEEVLPIVTEAVFREFDHDVVDIETRVVGVP